MRSSRILVSDGPEYEVALKVSLASPYFLRLTEADGTRLHDGAIRNGTGSVDQLSLPLDPDEFGPGTAWASC